MTRSQKGRVITWGAKISAAKKGHVTSDETRRKISETNKKKGIKPLHRAEKLSDEHKLHLSLSRSGEKHWNYKHGKSHTKIYKAFVQMQRKIRKLGNGGGHTLVEWEQLKAKWLYTCLGCLRKEPEIKLQADHVVPLVMGGSDDINNIQPLCGRCNSCKGTKAHDYRY